MQVQLRLDSTAAEPARAPPTRSEKKALAEEKSVLVARLAELKRTVEAQAATVSDSRGRLECMGQLRQVREELKAADQATGELIVSLEQVAAAPEQTTQEWRIAVAQIAAENVQISAHTQAVAELRQHAKVLLSECTLRELALKHLKKSTL